MPTEHGQSGRRAIISAHRPPTSTDLLHPTIDKSTYPSANLIKQGACFGPSFPVVDVVLVEHLCLHCLGEMVECVAHQRQQELVCHFDLHQGRIYRRGDYT